MKPKGKKKPPPASRSLLYKVVELSTVDEAALERAINEWVPQGWHLDGVQFAMRESSKRPSMAFVFFTREGSGDGRGRPASAAEQRLRNLAADGAKMPAAVSARERLAQLAEGEEGET